MWNLWVPSSGQYDVRYAELEQQILRRCFVFGLPALLGCWAAEGSGGGQYDVRYAEHEQRCSEVRLVLSDFLDCLAATGAEVSGGGQYDVWYAGMRAAIFRRCVLLSDF
jgi:hypothetical protein